MTATTLPGIKVHLEYLGRLSRGDSGLRVRWCREAVSDIDMMIESQAAPRPFNVLLEKVHLIEATMAVDEVDGHLVPSKWGI